MCETINCSLTINEDDKKAVISGLQQDVIAIDLSSDVDFTDLVSILTKLIDKQKKIVLTIEQDPTDEKLKLVTNTIKEIFQIYNENMDSLIEVDGMSD